MEPNSLRVAQLRSELEAHRYNYYVLEAPTISDGAYDSLMQELEQLEAKYPQFRDLNSPTMRVGADPLPKFLSQKHLFPMLSLNDVFSMKELDNWYQRMMKLLKSPPSLHLDIKMDGLAASLVYENGELSHGLTRGNGVTGEDITSNLRTIKTIPLKLRPGQEDWLYGTRVEVRGEVLISKSDFEQLNAERVVAGEPAYANPRNLAAGSVRQLDPKLAAARPLRFHAYRLILERPVDTLSRGYELARRLGFIVNQQHKSVANIDEAKQFIAHWQDERHKLPFNTDGIAIFIDSDNSFKQLGVAGKAPRGAIAYKYPAEQATTKVRDIEVNVGRTGAITPFAVLDPVVIAGSNVQLATLHNAAEIARKDIRIGDDVIVQKAGDIIPEVVASLPKLRDGSEKIFVMPVDCPSCSTLLVQPGEEKVARCPNRNCPSRIHRQIEHFASKQAFDIAGLGEQLVKRLLDAGLITDSGDLFKLTVEQLLKLEGFKTKSAQNLVESINSSKHPDFDRFIFGLGIRHVGRQTAIDLAQQFSDITALRAATLEKLANIEGVGDVVAEAIMVWFADAENQALLAKFKHLGVTPRVKEIAINGKLSGATFVITGTIVGMSRDEIAEQIRARGGKVTSTVSKNTTYVIVGDNPGQNKLDGARANSVTILDVAALKKLLS